MALKIEANFCVSCALTTAGCVTDCMTLVDKCEAELLRLRGENGTIALSRYARRWFQKNGEKDDTVRKPSAFEWIVVRGFLHSVSWLTTPSMD